MVPVAVRDFQSQAIPRLNLSMTIPGSLACLSTTEKVETLTMVRNQIKHG